MMEIRWYLYSWSRFSWAIFLGIKLIINLARNEHAYFLDPIDGRPDLRPGFRILTGSPGLIFLKKKLKRWRFSKTKKTKVNRLQPSFWSGLTGSTGSLGQLARLAGSYWVIFFMFFFSTWLGFNPGLAGFWIDPPDRAGF